MWALDNRQSRSIILERRKTHKVNFSFNPVKSSTLCEKKNLVRIMLQIKAQKSRAQTDAVVFLGREAIDQNSGMLRLLELSGRAAERREAQNYVGSSLSLGSVLSCTCSE